MMNNCSVFWRGKIMQSFVQKKKREKKREEFPSFIILVHIRVVHALYETKKNHPITYEIEFVLFFFLQNEKKFIIKTTKIKPTCFSFLSFVFLFFLRFHIRLEYKCVRVLLLHIWRDFNFVAKIYYLYRIIIFIFFSYSLRFIPLTVKIAPPIQYLKWYLSFSSYFFFVLFCSFIDSL